MTSNESIPDRPRERDAEGRSTIAARSWTDVSRQARWASRAVSSARDRRWAGERTL